MTIADNFARISFSFRRKTLVEGMYAEAPAPLGRPFVNPVRREVWSLLFAGTETNGTYTAVLLGDDGTRIPVSVVRTGGVPATHSDLAAQWVTNLLADPKRKGVVLDAGDIGDAGIVTFKHAGRTYSIGELSAPAPGTLAASETTSHEGTPLPVGRFVKIGEIDGLPAVMLLEDADPATVVAGVTLRPHTGIARKRAEDGPTASGLPEYPAGQMVSPVYKTVFAGRNYGTVASVPNGVVHVVRNDAGGLGRGVPSADAIANTIPLTLAQARWLEATEPGSVGPIYVNI